MVPILVAIACAVLAVAISYAIVMATKPKRVIQTTITRTWAHNPATGEQEVASVCVSVDDNQDQVQEEMRDWRASWKMIGLVLALGVTLVIGWASLQVAFSHHR